ncbi:MAG: OFA family MFS transporter [Lachnospiraceae bacterium]|jgi:OFA family oxalate/formate antiporter-like MFS transporter|nr:OFA family MFS transporter [Lachnospiraceae bacterium]
MNNKKTPNRNLVLAAGMVIQFCAGVIYMWSVFREPITAHLDWDAIAASHTATVKLSVFVLGIIIGGYIQDRVGPKIVTLTGSIMIGLGMIATALVTANNIGSNVPWLIYITYGVVAGLGVGAVYMCTIAAVQKWFPDRRGFASGMINCAFGLSLVVFAPLANTMMTVWSVPTTFLLFGVSFLIVCIICSLYIQNPCEHQFARYSAASPQVKAATEKKQYTPKEVVQTKQFYLLLFGMLFTLPAYMILNPAFVSLGMVRGLSNEMAVLGVSLTGVSSALGRLTVSWTSDSLGRKTSMVSIAVITLLASLILVFGESGVFIICIMLVAFAFGGSASIYATMTADSFGTKHGGMNLGLVMIGFLVSALVFPIISTRLTVDGNYTSSFILAAASCVVAIILVLMMKEPKEGVII